MPSKTPYKRPPRRTPTRFRPGCRSPVLSLRRGGIRAGRGGDSHPPYPAGGGLGRRGEGFAILVVRLGGT